MLAARARYISVRKHTQRSEGHWAYGAGLALLLRAPSIESGLLKSTGHRLQKAAKLWQRRDLRRVATGVVAVLGVVW